MTKQKDKRPTDVVGNAVYTANKLIDMANERIDRKQPNAARPERLTIAKREKKPE